MAQSVPLKLSVIAASLLGLAACGGGGSVGNTDTSGGGGTSTGTYGSNWTLGVFEDASKFKNLCERPRSGIDPFTGRAYPDQSGTANNEKFWLRSWSNDTYLWYDEIIDNNPEGYTIPNYFAQLKTNQTTAIGIAKDNFHFSQSTTEWNQQNQSGSSVSYGAKLVLISAAPPRKIIVSYIEPNSPASQVNLARGAEILKVNDVNVVDANDQASIDILNAGLFPSVEGTSYRFTIRDQGTETTRVIEMAAANVVSSPVQNVKTIPTTTGNVGYFQFNSHIATAEKQLKDAIDQLKATDVQDLVIDLRYNGGGLLALASQLGYMVAGPEATANKTFEKTVFNDKNPATNPVTGQTLTPFPFYNIGLGFSVPESEPLPNLGLKRVFVLSTNNTCSASEALVNGLRGIDVEVILVGGTTCGKPYGFYPTDNCGTTYFTIQFKGENAKGFGEYANGFTPASSPVISGESVPGCAIADDFSHQLGDPNEAMLSAALFYRSSGNCPAPSGAKSFISRTAQLEAIESSDGIQLQDTRPQTLLMNNRIITH